jgi:hypothetical protein
VGVVAAGEAVQNLFSPASYVTVTSVSSADGDRAHETPMVPAMRSGAMRA